MHVTSLPPIGGVPLFDYISGADANIDTAAQLPQGLPQDFRHLHIIIVSRHNTAEQVNSGGLQFNGDGGTNYGFNRSRVLAGAATATAGSAATSSACVISAGTSTANVWATNSIFIPNYSATMIKSMLAFGTMMPTSAATTNMDTYSIAGVWNSTGAITRIVYVPPATLIAASRMTIYGLP